MSVCAPPILQYKKRTPSGSLLIYDHHQKGNRTIRRRRRGERDDDDDDYRRGVNASTFSYFLSGNDRVSHKPSRGHPLRFFFFFFNHRHHHHQSSSSWPYRRWTVSSSFFLLFGLITQASVDLSASSSLAAWPLRKQMTLWEEEEEEKEKGTTTTVNYLPTARVGTCRGYKQTLNKMKWKKKLSKREESGHDWAIPTRGGGGGGKVKK